MVVALGPGKFYGSSLPRPRFYTDVKFNDERVDPPVPVLDPFMSWAEEAHWSMGGLSFERHRLQGRIEGNVKRLRAQREKFLKKRKQTATTTDQINGSPSKNVTPSPPPAPIATKRRRFLALIDEDDDENYMGNRESESGNEEKNCGGGGGVRRRSARKLGDDFDRVASESGLGKSKGSPVKSSGDGSDKVAMRTRSRRSEKEDDDMVEEVKRSNSKGKKLKCNGKAERVGENGASTPASGARTSPRLARRGST